MRAVGDFYDYHDTDGFRRVYEMRHRSIMPATCVYREWGSLLLDEKTQVVYDAAVCTEWLDGFHTKRFLGAHAGDGGAQLRVGNGRLRHLD